jgi:hypothetical protein
MRLYLAFTLVAAAVASLPANADESAVTALQCRSQVVFDCDKACEAHNQPADISLDFKAKTGSFCRGEQCNDATLASIEVAGQWDAKGYTVFVLGGGQQGFKVVGSISPDSKSFSAQSDEIGGLTGTCEPSSN